MHECPYCGALLWAGERLKKQKKLKDGDTPTFSLCCAKGKIDLPLLKDPPKLLKDLLTNKHPKSRHFLENIIAYNKMFAFTSMGGNFSPTQGRGPYCYTLHGQNFQKIGSLLPFPGTTPKFSQLYIYDTEHEDSNRINAIRLLLTYSKVWNIFFYFIYVIYFLYKLRF